MSKFNDAIFQEYLFDLILPSAVLEVITDHSDDNKWKISTQVLVVRLYNILRCRSVIHSHRNYANNPDQNAISPS